MSTGAWQTDRRSVEEESAKTPRAVGGSAKTPGAVGESAKTPGAVGGSAKTPGAVGESAKTPGAGKARTRPRTWARSFDAVLVATYACIVTVILPVTHRLAPSTARKAALLTLAVAVGGGVFVRRLGPAGRLVVSVGFVAGSVAVWILAKGMLGARLDPWLGVCGAVGWALWAVIWARDEPGEYTLAGTDWARPVRGSGNGVIQPHVELPRSVPVVSAVGCLAGVGLLVLAWFVSDRGRAMTAQGVALAGAAISALGSLRIASAWASPSPAKQAFGREPTHWRRTLLRARWPLLLVLAIALGGLVVGPVLGLLE